MRRVLLLNALLSVPWTQSYSTSDSDDHHDDESDGNGGDDSRTGDGWARSPWRTQGSSGNVSSSVGWD